MQESGENYLKTIYLLQNEGGTVHSVDVARALNFSKPSVSRAMGLLKDEKYIEIAKNGVITLTGNGRKKAKEIVDKQETLTRFFMVTADVPEELAAQEACKMEHFVQDKTYKGICRFMKQVDEYQE